MKRVKIQLTEQGIKHLEIIERELQNRFESRLTIPELEVLELHGEITQAHLIRRGIWASLQDDSYAVDEELLFGEYIKTTTVLIPKWVIERVQRKYTFVNAYDISTSEMINRCIDYGLYRFYKDEIA